MNKQNKITKCLFLAFLALFILIPSGLQNTHIVNANVGSGSGGVASNGKLGKWYYVYGGSSGSGNTEAWNLWRNYQTDRSDSRLSSALKRVGDKGIGGWGNESLEASCKRSSYIWWYGGTGAEDKLWQTYIGNGAHPTKDEMIDSMPSPIGKVYLEEFFKIPGNGWGQRGGTVIICSGSLGPAIPPKIPITITGDTKYFIWTGEQHKVTTWTRSGNVKKGHTVKANALGTQTDEGNSPVYVTNAKVVDRNNKDVSSQYKITSENGRIYVRKLPDGTERCVTKSTETVKGYTENKVTVTPGFFPKGAPPLETLNSTKNTEAKSKLSSLPKVGQSKSTWDTWKKDFENKGKDTSTNDITSLNNHNHNQAIGKYGGVLNVTRTHKIVEVEATLCQPQKRPAELISENQAGDWVNDGELEIEKITTKDLTPETYSYQILGVNCNVDGVEEVKKVHNIEKDLSYGNRQASALLQTTVRKGTDFPLGTVNDGLGGATATDSFYTDGPSCQGQFENACVSKKLDASAKNDANNNLQINPLFTHEDETEHGYPNDKDELVFFRDNEDRTVRADVWYPKNMSESGLITKQNEPAEKTIVKLYDGGTPEIDITTIETSTGSKKETKIDKFNENFTINGHVNKFNMKSQWASDEDKPYELGIDWVYKAEAENNIPTKLNGYELVDTGTYTADPFEVHCQFMNNKGEYAAQIPKNPFIDSKVANFKFNEDNAIRALFSRSVSDKSRQSDESKE